MADSTSTYPDHSQPSGSDHAILLTAGCKINLCLRIGDRRPDGYHELRSLFLPLPTPCDTLLLTRRPAEKNCLHVLCDTPGIDPHNNTLTKAYHFYSEAAGELPAFTVSLNKGIPHGAGLGGGSSDAAVLLRCLQKEQIQEGRPALTPEALNRLAVRVGADVPFFLLNAPAVVSGIGEFLEPVEPPCRGMFLVLACPNLHISTGWAFNALDALRGKKERGIEKKLTRTGSQDTTSCAHTVQPGDDLVNEFEEVVFQAFPQLARVRGELEEQGAAAARMSGTGSAIFGLFYTKDSAEKAAVHLQKDGLTVYMHSV